MISNSMYKVMDFSKPMGTYRWVNKVNVLVGVSGLIKIVGDIKLVNRLLKRAFNCYGDKEVCKLRRGVKITFYYQ